MAKSPKPQKKAPEPEQEVEKLIPDTSVLVEGLVSDHLKKGKITPKKIIIHEAVLSELEHQANENKETGYLGLKEISRLRELSSTYGFELAFGGRKPSAAEIKFANMGEIDALIRDLAYDEGGCLFTGDNVQKEVAIAKGMSIIFIQIEKLHKKLLLESYFDKTTMSVHLRENVVPYAKKGHPGEWTFVEVNKKKLTRELIQEISREIIEEASIRRDGFLEIERPGSTIVQLGKFRIVITKPAFSDGWEITAVRPVRKLTLDEYELPEKLRQRIISHAEGILIAGAPGHGKSTFAQALAEHYASSDKIVKTIEAPRDLSLPDNVTQYSMSQGGNQEIHDILLLTRPDYTIFDEMRNTDDFRLFADLRLSGVGMVGIVHATNPVDAVQRFVGRIELGVIPQIIDTVIFIKNGNPEKILSLTMTVKVPAGMTEADLARPIVVVQDFMTGKAEYELYTYGEETVVVPVMGYGDTKKPAHHLAEQSIEKSFYRYSDRVKVDMISDHKAVVFVPEGKIAAVIGKQGKNIQEMEAQLGIKLDVKSLDTLQESRPPKDSSGKRVFPYQVKMTKNHVQLMLDHQGAKKDVDIFLGDDYLMSAKAGKSGMIKISKKNKIGRLLAEALTEREDVRVLG
ncbi:MAG: Flp pilus assembly complex ATPase component [DPANN group archaeon]|nr:Flp pilus assembly complex ATPase component [DPANN group archaeon]